MILTEKQAKAELRLRGSEARREVIEAFEECREFAAWLAYTHEAEADREEAAPSVLWARFWCRFWRFFEARHASHVEWVRSLELAEEGAGDETTG